MMINVDDDTCFAQLRETEIDVKMMRFSREGGNLLAQAAAGVRPFEAPRQYVADIAEIEKEKRHSYYRVHYSCDFAPFRPGTNVAVTCAVNENAASEFIDELRVSSSRLVSISCFIRPVRELIHI